MKRMRDYTKWPTPQLVEKAGHHLTVIARCEAHGTPCGANRILLRTITGILGERGVSFTDKGRDVEA